MLTKVGFYQNLNLRHGNLHDEGEHGGRYISVSKEGVINFWSMDMHLQRSVAVRYKSLSKAHSNITFLTLLTAKVPFLYSISVCTCMYVCVCFL